MRVGQLCQLNLSVATAGGSSTRHASSSPSSSSSSSPFLVTGILIASRPHVEDEGRVLFYFHTTRIEQVSAVSSAASAGASPSVTGAGGSAAQQRRRLPALTTARERGVGGGGGGGGRGGNRRAGCNEFHATTHSFSSTEGYTYRYDGWYDADDLLLVPVGDATAATSLDEDEELTRAASSSTTTISGGGGGGGGERVLPDEWLEMMEKDTAACEVRYLCYSVRPWFDSPFQQLKYLALPERTVCYSVSLCHRCLSPFFSSEQLTTHLEGYCGLRSPPGVLLYHDRSTHRKVYFVDGAEHLHYARCLSLLGKCFIESKVLYNDVDIYEFFVTTVPRSALPLPRGAAVAFASEADFRSAAAEYDAAQWEGDVVVGYFSRLKHRADHTLSCIVTLPMFQHLHLATFMLNVAYFLTAQRQRVCGCAQYCGRAGGAISRPLSPCGQLLLLAYWGRVIRRSLCRNTAKASPLQFASLNELVAALDTPLHVDDVALWLAQDEFAFYASLQSARGNGRSEHEEGTGTSLSFSSSSYASSPSPSSSSSLPARSATLSVKSGHDFVCSIVFDHADVTEAEGGNGYAGAGAFQVKYMTRDAQGELVYSPKLFHY